MREGEGEGEGERERERHQTQSHQVAVYLIIIYCIFMLLTLFDLVTTCIMMFDRNPIPISSARLKNLINPLYGIINTLIYGLRTKAYRQTLRKMICRTKKIANQIGSVCDKLYSKFIPPPPPLWWWWSSSSSEEEEEREVERMRTEQVKGKPGGGEEEREAGMRRRDRKSVV